MTTQTDSLAIRMVALESFLNLRADALLQEANDCTDDREEMTTLALAKDYREYAKTADDVDTLLRELVTALEALLAFNEELCIGLNVSTRSQTAARARAAIAKARAS